MNRKYKANGYKEVMDVSDMTVIYTYEDTVHILNSLASRIFYGIIAGKEYQSILAEIISVYPTVDRDVIRRDMDELIKTLIAKEIVVIDGEYDEA